MMSKKALYLFLVIVSVATLKVFSQDIPDRPNPPRLVNDFAGMLNDGQVSALERKLVSFNDSTSTQIAIVTVKSLGDYAPSDFAQRLAQKWGVGQRGMDNGLLILVKPKIGNSAGQVRIETGYGLEGAVPDITAAEIVDYEILPAFREGDYYGGLESATNTIMDLVRGEYTAKEYAQRAQGNSGEGKNSSMFVVLLVVFLIIMLSRRGGGRGGGGRRRITGRNDLPFWLLMSMLGSGGGRSRGSWGGGGGFGRGGGGFGGFGGGSFGGGGAGGSW
jgi:uncharacterized protein